MDLLDHEKEIASHGTLVLTSHSVIKNTESWGKKYFKDIPLNRLDAITCSSERILALLIIGIAVALVGFGLILADIEPGLLLAVGVLLIVLGVFLKYEYVVFHSGNVKIREEAKGSHAFVQKVRRELHKK